MTNHLELEFINLSTDDLKKAYASAIEASTLAAQEMAHKAEAADFRAVRLRLDYCLQACEDLREALSLRIASPKSYSQSLGA